MRMATSLSAVITATRLVAIPLATLLERIRRHAFARVHRGHAVNLEQVVRIVPRGDGRPRVEMRVFRQVLASRRGSHELRRVIG